MLRDSAEKLMRKHRRSCAGLLVVACVVSGAAQTRSTLNIPGLDLLRPEITQDLAPTASREFALDAPLDPEEYLVGPSDLVGINIWSSAPKEYRLTVTPEATVLLPNVGPLDVRNSTLAQVKIIVAEHLRRIYPSSKFSVTLLAPRKVLVQVTGSVVNEGLYEMLSIQRVADLLEEGDKPTKAQAGSQEFKRLREIAKGAASERNIMLKRRDGTMVRVDLARYSATGERRWNPYLREGDIVHVPERTLFEKSIAVFGGVIRPWSFEFVPGDSLLDLVRMGLGLSAGADTLHGVLTRLSADGGRMDSMGVDLRGLVSVGSGNLALRPGDRLVIRQRREERLNYYVSVEGQVRYPGLYPITRGSTGLSDVIKAAGGISDRAFVKGGTITRASLVPLETDEQIDQEKLRSMKASLSLQDSGYYLTEVSLRLKGEQVSVDFHRLLVLGDSSADILLSPFDRIHIPPRQNTVYVFGQVQVPGHISLRDGESYAYYVEQAGGFTNEARSGDVKVIKGWSRIWLDPGETEIEDGDFIWVPKEIHYPFSYYLALYAQVAVIIGSVATVALLVKSY